MTTYPLGTIMVDPTDFNSVSVTFTSPTSGLTPKVYNDAYGVSSISLPHNTTHQKLFYVEEGNWTVSATVNEVEMCGRTVLVRHGQGASVGCGPTGPPKFGTNIGDFMPGNTITGGTTAGSIIVAAPTGIAAVDTLNIQDALNSGSSDVAIQASPTQIYEVNASLSIPEGVHFYGLGPNKMQYAVEGAPGYMATIRAVSGFTGPCIAASAGWLSGATNADNSIEVDHICFAGNSAYIGSGSGGTNTNVIGDAIIIYSRGASVHDCTFIDIAGTAVVIVDRNINGQGAQNSVQENYVLDNKISGCGAYGIWIQSTRSGGVGGVNVGGNTDGFCQRNVISAVGGGQTLGKWSSAVDVSSTGGNVASITSFACAIPSITPPSAGNVSVQTSNGWAHFSYTGTTTTTVLTFTGLTLVYGSGTLATGNTVTTCPNLQTQAVIWGTSTPVGTTNPNIGYPYEGIHMSDSAGWWCTDNHPWGSSGSCMFFNGTFSTHIVDNNSDIFAQWPIAGSGQTYCGIQAGVSSGKQSSHTGVISGNTLAADEGITTTVPGSPSPDASISFHYIDVNAGISGGNVASIGHSNNGIKQTSLPQSGTLAGTTASGSQLVIGTLNTYGNLDFGMTMVDTAAAISTALSLTATMSASSANVTAISGTTQPTVGMVVADVTNPTSLPTGAVVLSVGGTSGAWTAVLSAKARVAISADTLTFTTNNTILVAGSGNQAPTTATAILADSLAPYVGAVTGTFTGVTAGMGVTYSGGTGAIPAGTWVAVAGSGLLVLQNTAGTAVTLGSGGTLTFTDGIVMAVAATASGATTLSQLAPTSVAFTYECTPSSAFLLVAAGVENVPGSNFNAGNTQTLFAELGPGNIVFSNPSMMFLLTKQNQVATINGHLTPTTSGTSTAQGSLLGINSGGNLSYLPTGDTLFIDSSLNGGATKPTAATATLTVNDVNGGAGTNTISLKANTTYRVTAVAGGGGGGGSGVGALNDGGGGGGCGGTAQDVWTIGSSNITATAVIGAGGTAGGAAANGGSGSNSTLTATAPAGGININDQYATSGTVGTYSKAGSGGIGSANTSTTAVGGGVGGGTGTLTVGSIPGSGGKSNVDSGGRLGYAATGGGGGATATASGGAGGAGGSFGASVGGAGGGTAGSGVNGGAGTAATANSGGGGGGGGGSAATGTGASGGIGAAGYILIETLH